MSRFPRAFAAFGVATALCALSALPVAPVVAAPLSDANSTPAAQAEKSRPITTPDPSGPDAHEDSTWANPLARSTDPKQDVRLEITDIAPAEAPPEAHGAQAQDPAASQTYTLRIRNDRPRALSNLSLTLYYRTAATSAEVRVAQIANQGEYALRSEPLQLDGILGPGESREVQVTLPLGADSHDAPSAQSLTIPANAFKEPGAYPLLFSLSGQDTNPEDAGQSGVQYLAVTRTTLTVGASERKEEQPSTPVTVLYPLAGQTYMAPGQTGDAPKRRPAFLTKDQLAKEVADGGRLRGLLDAYREAKSKKLKQATCIAIDPEPVSYTHLTLPTILRV